MASIQVRIRSGPQSTVIVDRVPVPGEYVAGTQHLFRVEAVLTPRGGAIDAVVFAVRDGDGQPDQLLGLILPADG